MVNFRTELCRLEDFNAQNEKRFDEKQHEVAQLNSQLEQLREESARQVARAKERTDTVRRSLQNQISDMERQLAQTRASCRSAQKERDDVSSGIHEKLSLFCSEKTSNVYFTLEAACKFAHYTVFIRAKLQAPCVRGIIVLMLIWKGSLWKNKRFCKNCFLDSSKNAMPNK